MAALVKMCGWRNLKIDSVLVIALSCLVTVFVKLVLFTIDVTSVFIGFFMLCNLNGEGGGTNVGTRERV